MIEGSERRLSEPKWHRGIVESKDNMGLSAWSGT